ncbi:chromosome segregation protein [Xylariomycetidae sp. FL2044]|nr:chromosome segregation protein [Xylariomycetidae sp. FL2044]
MSRARATALLGLVESDGDEDFDVLSGGSSSAPNRKTTMPPARKARGATADKATKPAATTTRRTGRGTTTAAVAKEPARKALAEKPANAQQKTTQGRGRKRQAVDDPHDENLVDSETKPKAARGRPRATKVQRITEAEDGSDKEQPEPEVQPTAKRRRKPQEKAVTPPAEVEIPETQPQEPEIPETQPAELMDITIEEDDQIEELPSYRRVGLSFGQSPRPLLSASRRRPTPASDSELHDPSMRRRVGDLTRKYESLEAKYRDLRELGINQAEHNYDRLKKQGEERADTANQLIATLKAQLSAQTELAREAQQLRQQLEASQSQITSLEENVGQLTGSLSEAKTEIKTLSTKLASARSAEAASAKIPSSAIKGPTANNRLLANAEAAAQVAQMKEDLYGDLTGLIIRGAKREGDEEVYDCIQTGRNGTLHFKLAVGVDGSLDNFDETQFMYMPQLDPDRDADLVDLLPDFLVEEITFPRPHAAKFYARVMKSLTERLD